MYLCGEKINFTYKNTKTMKKIFISLLFGAILCLCMNSCSLATGLFSGTTGMTGSVYTGYTEPVTVTSNSCGQKVGSAKCVSVLGLLAMGDAGVQEAARKAGITKISHVDKKVLSVLGLFTIHEFFVYGE